MSHFLRVWWKRSILPWVCGCPGGPFFCVIPRDLMTCSKWLGRPVLAAKRVVKISPLSVRVDAGRP